MLRTVGRTCAFAFGEVLIVKTRKQKESNDIQARHMRLFSEHNYSVIGAGADSKPLLYQVGKYFSICAKSAVYGCSGNARGSK